MPTPVPPPIPSRSDPTPTARCTCGYALFEGQDCPECGRSFAEATRVAPTSSLWIASLVALLAAAFVASSFSCTCGHLGRFALPFSSLVLALAWWPFLFARDSRVVTRGLALIAVVSATMLLLKNVADVLWLGHQPVF